MRCDTRRSVATQRSPLHRFRNATMTFCSPPPAVTASVAPRPLAGGRSIGTGSERWFVCLRPRLSAFEPLWVDGDLFGREPVVAGDLTQPLLVASKGKTVTVRVAHDEVPHAV
jgi:hypothetical protein